MPIIYRKNIDPEGVVGVWQIEEDLSFFIEALEMDVAELEYLERFKGKRKIEWLASRYLLHHLSERKVRGKLYKDEFGKPHLENSEYQISLSHSRNMVAVIGAPKKVGVDIQVHVEKIVRLVPKFANEKELEMISLSDVPKELMHIIWGAKECIFKAYGRKEVDFKSHISVMGIENRDLHPMQFEANFNKADTNENYKMHFDLLNDYYLIYGIEN